jgi:hypothetical protein
MQGLRIFSRSGAAPTSEEIEAAHRIASTHKEMRFGVITAEDAVHGVRVEYHPLKKIAFTSSGLKYFFNLTHEPYCQCRELNAVNGGTQQIQFERVTEYVSTGSSAPGSLAAYAVSTVTLKVDDVVIETYTGRWDYFWTTTGSGVLFVYDNWLGGQISADSLTGGFFNGSYPYGAEWTGVFDNQTFPGTNTLVRTLIPGYGEAAEAALASSEDAPRTKFYLDDGTILLSVIASNDGEGNATNILIPGNPSWTGGNTVLLYDTEGGEIVNVNEIPIDIPEDVCVPDLDEETYPTTMAIAKTRFREFKVACSDATLLQLTAGELPDGIEPFLKDEHPASLKIESIPPFEVTLDITMTGGAYDVFANVGIPSSFAGLVAVYSQEVEFKFLDEQGEEVIDVQTGTIEIYRSFHSTNGTATIIGDEERIEYRNNIFFTNWFVGNPDTGYSATIISGYPLPDTRNYSTKSTPVADRRFFTKEGYALGYMLDGESYLEDGTTIYPYTPSTDVGIDIEGKEIIPPFKYPKSVFYANSQSYVTDNPVVLSQIPAYIDYRTRYKPQYDAELAEISDFWVDAAIVDKERITLYPVQYSSETLGDLGMYPVEEDKESITGIYLTKGYEFKYSYAAGTFEFVGEKEIVDKRTGEVSARIDLPKLYDVEPGTGGGSEGKTLQDAVEAFGFPSMEALLLAFGMPSKEAFYAILGISTDQQFIELVFAEGGGAVPVYPNFIVLSSRKPTKWTDVDDTYKEQPATIRDAYDEEEAEISLAGLYDFLS